jgi:hypothetical protein
MSFYAVGMNTRIGAASKAIDATAVKSPPSSSKRLTLVAIISGEGCRFEDAASFSSIVHCGLHDLLVPEHFGLALLFHR